MDRILGFDVSNHSCSVAVTVGNDILAYEEELRPSMQAERLLSMIKAALKQADLGYQDINYLALTNGPGSFTGIRIGLAAAQGILFSCPSIKGLTITNFEMSYYRALQQVGHAGKIFIILNAYRGQVYLQEFNQPYPPSSPQLLDIADAYQMLAQSESGVICAGSGLICFMPKLQSLANVIWLPRFKTPKASHICRYAQIKIKQFASNGQVLPKLEPLYIRPPDAAISTKI